MTHSPEEQDPGWAPPDATAPPVTGPPAAEPAAPAAPSGEPAAPDDPPAGPPEGPAGPVFPPPGQGPRQNTAAVIALVFGLIGMIPLAVGFGIAALVQIKKRGERGRGLALGGLAAAGVWTVVTAIVVVASVVAVNRYTGGTGRPLGQLYPKPGECYDMPPGEAAIPLNTACDTPHDAQMIAVHRLPEAPWPGDTELQRIGHAACVQRVRALLGTRTPVEDGLVSMHAPTRIQWRLGERDAHCVVIAQEGGKLTAPIEMRDVGIREWGELRARECIDFPQERPDVRTVRVVGCTTSHPAQVTHVVMPPAGPWPGQKAAGRQAADTCRKRWASLFGSRPPKGTVMWHRWPTKWSWENGERQFHCLAYADQGFPLKRSVVPR